MKMNCLIEIKVLALGGNIDCTRFFIDYVAYLNKSLVIVLCGFTNQLALVDSSSV